MILTTLLGVWLVVPEGITRGTMHMAAGFTKYDRLEMFEFWEGSFVNFRVGSFN